MLPELRSIRWAVGLAACVLLGVGARPSRAQVYYYRPAPRVAYTYAPRYYVAAPAYTAPRVVYRYAPARGYAAYTPPVAYYAYPATRVRWAAPAYSPAPYGGPYPHPNLPVNPHMSDDLNTLELDRP